MPEPDLPAIDEGTAKVKTPNINRAMTIISSDKAVTTVGFRRWSPQLKVLS
ncbi:MAG: hypothetical protein ACYSUD_07225 [Planctomycetota bacterium]